MATKSEILLIDSPDKISQLTQQVAGSFKFDSNKIDKLVFSQYLQTFLESVYPRLNISAIAFCNLNQRPFPPVLDTYLLWSRPVKLLADAQELRDITAEHAKFSLRLYPDLSSLINYTDPRLYLTPELLCIELSERSQTNRSLEFLSCAKFLR